MFKTLQFKLTAYNTLILAIFIIFFITVIYFIIDKTISAKTDDELELYAVRLHSQYEIPNKSIVPFFGEDEVNMEQAPRSLKKYINYILRDPQMQVISASQDNKFLESTIRETAREVLMEEQPRCETVEFEGEKIRVYTVPFTKGQERGIIQTYISIEFKQLILSHTLTSLIILAIIGIIFAAILGWKLARRASIPIKEAWEKQKNFVADASHELRTPLTIMQTNLEVALADSGGSIADNQQWLDNVYSEAQNMAKLLNDLLMLAQIDAREIEIEMQTFNLSEMLKELAEQMRPVFDNKSLCFESLIPADVQFQGDRAKIRQLLMIFFDNAIKYTPTGGKIRLAVTSKENKIQIIIADSGIGIPPEEKEKIFQRFYRIDKARSRSQGGTGLGLSIAAWIMDIHKGKIKVESHPGQGTTFVLEFFHL